MGMVFQHFNLFPHLTVQQNLEIAPGLLKTESSDAIKKRCQDLLQKLVLLIRHRPTQQICLVDKNSVWPLHERL